MSDKQQNNVKSNRDFDYFIELIKNRKLILITAAVFLTVTLIYVFLLPKNVVSKSSFSISLDEQIETPYGIYKYKTRNPSHYTELLEKNSFKHSVCNKFGINNPKDVQFTVIEDEVKFDAKTSGVVYPKKYDLIVQGVEGDVLNNLNRSALNRFLSLTDSTILNDMYINFMSKLKNNVDDLMLEIASKQQFVEVLRKDNLSKSEVNTDKTNLNNLIDDRIVNSLKGSERGVLIAMLLNGEQGKHYYREMLLSYQEVELEVLKNQLVKSETLMEKLNDANETNQLSALFGGVFSSNFIQLTEGELQKMNGGLTRDLKFIFLALFLGLFLSSVFVLFRSYMRFYQDQF
ncbi:hypothetical protein CW751_10680 [Brumimicrobium salinarum]|uniref:Polysaccharide chain length determinant N-terminal domain-containing protein n=1 Tax=Brumimicrobium salinarum TaxID=2058658 RepID=A0A2I0R158_9FLAO|nr:hypothetical protein [Brumimicrobium salinarum]PKR80308.1 hypothetical protein CW751_10680 [Brumimicrobium salinarum]